MDLSLLSLVGLIHERQEKLDEAIFDLRSIVALDPQNATWRRRLGNLWIKVGKYERAFIEWQTVLALSGIHSVSDYLACAQVALQAGHLNQTVELCESVLQDDANNGNALGLLGQAFVARGEPQQAMNFLVRATRLSPETLTHWLALARVQEDLGEPQQALETLRSAVTAVPEASEGHLALGHICVQSGMLAEALPHLKKAFQLSPQSEQAALLYGQTLRILGHANEAGSVFEKVRSSWTACPELAYEYAQVLLDLDHAENALPVLETALHNGLPVLDGYLLYAKILLENSGPVKIAGMLKSQGCGWSRPMERSSISWRLIRTTWRRASWLPIFSAGRASSKKPWPSIEIWPTHRCRAFLNCVGGSSGALAVPRSSWANRILPWQR